MHSGEELALSVESTRDAEAHLLESQERVKILSVPPPEVPGADRAELLRMLDRRQHEIEQITKEWRELSAKLASVTSERSKSQIKYVH